MTTLGYDVATAHVLWRRDLSRFWRQPSRVVGALGQPAIFWLVIGSGFAATFQIPGVDVGYMTYFFPGVVSMVILFASIFAAVSVIEDRHQGFLQAVLAGPGSRAALVLGKSAGSASVALIQAGLFVALAPLAGYPYAQIDWAMLAVTAMLASFGLTALGFAVAWWLDNTQAYHAIQMVVLVPLWVISGAMFPPGDGLYRVVMTYNPIAYAVSAMRHAFYGGAAPAATVVTDSPWLEVGVVGGFAAVAIALAVVICTRRR